MRRGLGEGRPAGLTHGAATGLRDRLAERLAADLRRFEHLLGHQIPSQWKWSTSVSA
jgi:hypothetical protein